MNYTDRLKRDTLGHLTSYVLKKELMRQHRHINIMVNDSLQRLATLQELYYENFSTKNPDQTWVKETPCSLIVKNLSKEIRTEQKRIDIVEQENQDLTAQLNKVKREVKKYRAKNHMILSSISQKIRKNCRRKSKLSMSFKSQSNTQHKNNSYPQGHSRNLEVPKDEDMRTKTFKQSKSKRFKMTGRYTEGPETLKKCSSIPSGLQVSTENRI